MVMCCVLHSFAPDAGRHLLSSSSNSDGLVALCKFFFFCFCFLFSFGYSSISAKHSRFFRFMFILFSVHEMALGLFLMMASIARDMIIANTFGSAAILVVLLLGGFILPKDMIKPWWVWDFWLSPLSYGQRAISVNEFIATRWMEFCFSLWNAHDIWSNLC